MSPNRVARAINIKDLRRLAKNRVPRIVFEYVDGGAEGEVTLQENCKAFREITFRPRQAVDAGVPDLQTTVLGHETSFPTLLAPVGYARLMYPGGEIAAAKAAGDAGTIYILSTISGHKLENVSAVSKVAVWYQLYLTGGRQPAEAALRRAADAGFSALVITVDSAVTGLRERDVRHGMHELLAGSVFKRLPFLPQVLARPRWLASFLLDGGLPKLENIVLPDQGPMSLVDVAAALGGNVFTWRDLEWIRPLWKGPIVIKGVLTAEDATRAVDEGAAAVVVSNHGGRQLDCVPASLRALPEVVAAVGDRSRGVDGRRRPARQRHREGTVSRSACRSHWACLCIWSCGGWRTRRGSGACDSEE